MISYGNTSISADVICWD